ncbi:MAG TPA: BON domain-containing protein [Chloroflexota bacterium]|jgi:hypothetical protein|nr:BON domain-containing protein [Chloroflexota bacterium]
MNTPVWLIDLKGEVELLDGTSNLDGVIVRPSDRAVLAIGIRTGFLNKRTVWTSVNHLVRANGSRTWLSVRHDDLSDRPPDGVWVRADLGIRYGTVSLGMIGWVGVAGGVVEELGVVPLDPRMQPRRISASTIVALNDRSVVVQDVDFEAAPLLRTDRELEEEIRRRLWDTLGSLPAEALERINVSVDGGVVTLLGMVPKDRDRELARTIAHEPLEVRGVNDRVETAESLAASAQQLRAAWA